MTKRGFYFWLIIFLILSFANVSCKKKEKINTLIVSMLPEGELDSNQLKQLEFTFSSLMIEEDEIRNKPKFSISFSPSILGEFLWTDKDKLVFFPSESIENSTKYKVTVPKGILAKDGSLMLKPLDLFFSTPAISGEINIVGDIDRAIPLQVFRINFDQTVSFEEVEKKCFIDINDQKIKIKIEPEHSIDPSVSFRVVPVSDLPLNKTGQFVCKKGLKGLIGTLGITEELKLDFKTYGPLKFDSVLPKDEHITPSENLRFKIYFSNPLEKPYKIIAEPKIPGFPKDCHVLGSHNTGLDCAMYLEANLDYKIIIDQSQKDVFGQKLGKKIIHEFKTKDALPSASMESGYFVAELTRPQVPIWTRNITSINMRTVKITPMNYHEIAHKLDWWYNSPTDLSKTKLKPREKKIKITAPKNKWNQYSFDPAQLYGEQQGPGMYYIELGSDEAKNGVFDSYWHDSDSPNVIKALVNFTNIGVVTKLAPTRSMVWTTNLSTGTSLPGANVVIRDMCGKMVWSGKTNGQGIAYLPGKQSLMNTSINEESECISYSNLNVFVRHGNDWTMVNALRSGGLSASNFDNITSTPNASLAVKLRGFVHTDRGLYKPGDTVHIKGLVRESRLATSLKVPKKRNVFVKIYDSQGALVNSQETRLSDYGGFWLDVELPKDSRLGSYRILAEFDGGKFTENFSVEEYVPATFEVKIQADKKRIVNRGSINIQTSADYFYGAKVTDGTLDFSAYIRPRQIRFNSFLGFNFEDRTSRQDFHSSRFSQSLISSEQLVLGSDGSGSVNLEINHDVTRNNDVDVVIMSNVTSSSNERIGKSLIVPYFRYNNYLGIKASGYYAETGNQYDFEVVQVNPEGKATKGSAEVVVKRKSYNCVWETWGYRGSYKCETIEDEILRRKISLESKPVKLSFTPKRGGDYTIEVKGTNQNQANASYLFYAYGGDSGYPKSDDNMTFDIIADKEAYQEGDIAKLVFITDLAEATALVTIERDGIVDTEFVEISKENRHIEIPITKEYAPNIYVSASLVQGRTGEGQRGMPKMRMGLINLQVSPRNNILKVSIETDKKDYQPGDEVSATIKVTDNEGKPVQSEIALVAADEGVLSLINYRTPNPIPTFYAQWGNSILTASLYNYIRDIPRPDIERPAFGADLGSPDFDPVRSRFMATAVWKPGIVTDGTGTANVSFKAPDNLTAYRVMAIVADKGYRFGSSEQRFTVSKPLQLHKALPRFSTMSDTLKGGVIVHNETGKEGEVTVSIKSDEHVLVKGESTKTVKVPKNGRLPVLFDLEAVEKGEAELVFSADMGEYKDSVLFKIPVNYPSHVNKAVLKHGSTTTKVSVPLKLPKGGISNYARVIVSLDPYGLSGIEEGLSDLIGYPYGCLEQTVSKVIPMVLVQNLVEMLKINDLSGEKIKEFVEAGISKIGKHQSRDGGFSLWIGGDSTVYNTAYALFGLHLAREAGYLVNEQRIKDGLSYLRYEGRRENKSNVSYNRAGHLGEQVFALFVMALLGNPDTQYALRMKENWDILPVYGKAFLLKALATDLGGKDTIVVPLYEQLKKLAKDAIESEKLIKETQGLRWYMSSDLRTTAVVMDALVSVNSQDPVGESLVGLIMKSRRNTRYLSTQENIYSLLALINYSRVFASKEVPTVTVFLDEKEIFSGQLDKNESMKILTYPLEKANDVTISSDGKVFYNVSLEYYESRKAITARSQGISIKREYLDEKGIPKNKFKVRDVVLVRLTLPLKSSVNHIVISDRIPAGFEIINTRFATTVVAKTPTAQRYNRPFTEMHDERVDFSHEYLYSGEKVYEYLIRAIVPGKFLRPPVNVELMYEPTVNARTGIDYIEVEAQ